MRISDWSSDVCSSDLPDKDKGETLVSAETVIPVPAEWAARAKVDTARYAEMYRQSLGDPDAFWLEHGRRIDWIKPFTKVSHWSFDEAYFGIKWSIGRQSCGERVLKYGSLSWGAFSCKKY